MIVTRVRWVAFILAVYLLFNAVSFLTLPAYLLASPRLQFVFENMLSQQGVAIIYICIALLLMVAFSYQKLLALALTFAGLVNVFWGTVSILPVLLGITETGSATGASTLYAFSAVVFIAAIVSYRQYNWNPKV